MVERIQFKTKDLCFEEQFKLSANILGIICYFNNLGVSWHSSQAFDTSSKQILRLCSLI